MPGKKKGLYANIAAKKRRIKAGSGEKMRKLFENFKEQAKKPVERPVEPEKCELPGDPRALSPKAPEGPVCADR